MVRLAKEIVKSRIGLLESDRFGQSIDGLPDRPFFKVGLSQIGVRIGGVRRDAHGVCKYLFGIVQLPLQGRHDAAVGQDLGSKGGGNPL